MEAPGVAVIVHEVGAVNESLMPSGENDEALLGVVVDVERNETTKK